MVESADCGDSSHLLGFLSAPMKSKHCFTNIYFFGFVLALLLIHQDPQVFSASDEVHCLSSSGKPTQCAIFVAHSIP